MHMSKAFNDFICNPIFQELGAPTAPLPQAGKGPLDISVGEIVKNHPKLRNDIEKAANEITRILFKIGKDAVEHIEREEKFDSLIALTN